VFSEVFPSRLKEMRKSHGFTQMEVAHELKIHHVNISHYETGAREPDVETLAQFADFYGASADWLIGVRPLPSKHEYFLSPESNWDGVKVRSNDFPAKMKTARASKEISQAKAAKELKIPQSTLAKYELGQLQPSLETLANITMFYNVTADWLLGLSDTPASPLTYKAS